MDIILSGREREREERSWKNSKAESTQRGRTESNSASELLTDNQFEASINGDRRLKRFLTGWRTFHGIPTRYKGVVDVATRGT